MKKLVLLAVAAMVAVGAVVLSVRHYNQYQNKIAHEQRVASEKAAEQARQERQAAEAKQARILEQYTKVRLECEKGLGLHARLTPFQRQDIPAPNCGPAVIQ